MIVTSLATPFCTPDGLQLLICGGPASAKGDGQQTRAVASRAADRT
jgi:hypothetical protein